MDIRQLRHFIQVYDCGSFAAAAKENFISPQGISMSVLRLEEELRCRLFLRTPGGLELTEEGRYLLPRARHIADKMDELERHYRTGTGGRLPVRVASAFGSMPEVGGGLFQGFEASCPRYAVLADEFSDVDCDSAVRQGRYEIGFGVSPFDEDIFESWPLVTVDSCLLVRRDHPLAARQSVTAEVLRDLPVMAMSDKFKSTQNLRRVCTARGFEPELTFAASEASAILRMVAQGLGAGITIRSVAEAFHDPEVTAVPFEEPELAWSIHMFKRRGHALSPGGQALKRYVLRRSARGLAR